MAVERTAELRREVTRRTRASVPHSLELQVKFVSSPAAAAHRRSTEPDLDVTDADSTVLQGAGHG